MKTGPAAATPALAPGTMILLGALGFGYAYLIGRE